MNPTLKDIRFDPILSNVSVAYKNEDYIAEKVFPVIRVKSATGKYFSYDKSNLRKENSLRGMGSHTNEVDYGVSQSTAFVIKEHALKEIVPDELIEQAPAPLNPEIDATENVTEKLLVEKEYDLATYMNSTTNLSNNRTLSAAEYWSRNSTATPISAIQAAKVTVHAAIFKQPNTVIVSKEVYDQLVNVSEIIERIKYVMLGVATTDLLAKVFGVSQVLVASAGYESATEGATSSLAYIWAKNCWVAYITPRPGIKQISFGYHFVDKPKAVDKWYNKDRKGTFVRVTDRYVREVVSTDACYLLKTVVT